LQLIADFKRWFGHEVPALVGRTGRPINEVAQISGRALQNWRQINRPGEPE
jgi:hypothetical protein